LWHLFCAPESTAFLITRFCERTKRLPYSARFVSIAVLRLQEDPCDSGATIYGVEDKPSLAPIHYAVLKQSPELLACVELVGDDDLKQILTVIAKRWNNKEEYASVIRRAKDLRSLPVERRLSEMRKWTYSRGQRSYSEARLNRPLTWQEVTEWGICDNAIGS
jgi:hypothetical protein